jgi:ABC-type transport system involved in multi-copper enzyme maturation permease subunit
MSALLAIAGNTVRELVRGKLLYNLLLFTALFVAGSLLVAQLTVGNWVRIILDMGLGAMEVSGALMAIVIGVGIVAGEIQRKTILPTLAKPLPRWTFCVGRYAGLVLLLAVNALAIVAVLRAVLWLAGYPLAITTAQAAALLCVEFALLAAVAVLFASFSTPILAGSYAFAVFFIGHLLPDLRAFADKAQSAAARNLANGFYLLLPDLELLNLKSHASNELAVAGSYVWSAAGYGIAYAAVVLALAVLVLSRRDLN